MPSIHRLTTPRARAWPVIALVVALGGPGAPVAAASPAPADAPATCADAFPIGDVVEGLTATGWTAVSGATPEPFAAEVLGVLEDWVAPGRDVILVEVSDLPGGHVIEAGGGIWAGMSGSPVYVGDRLVGAVAYGFTDGPSHLAGLTPAAEMLRLLTLPTPTRTVMGAPSATSVPSTAARRRAVMRLTGVGSAAAATFDRLPLPFFVSGVGSSGRKQLAEDLAAVGIGAIVVRGASVPRPSPTTTPVTPVPGGGFAAMVAYGSTSIGAVGTTTWVCGDRAIAFGHPLELTGAARVGASVARTLAVVTGGSGVPYKLTAIGGRLGTVDQDRLAGLRARLGVLLPLGIVRARVTDLDLGVTRTKRSFAVTTPWLAQVAPMHVFQTVLSVTDRYGAGTAEIRVAIDGRRANGAPFSVVVEDRMAYEEIQYVVASFVDSIVGTIAYNPFERVTIDKVAVRSTIEEALRVVEIRSVAIARNGTPVTPGDGGLRVRRGDRLDLTVRLRRSDGTRFSVPLSLVVPAEADGYGELLVSSGGAWGCMEWGCEEEASSFASLLRRLRTVTRGDDLQARLTFWGDEGPGVSVTDTTRLGAVVRGDEHTEVHVR